MSKTFIQYQRGAAPYRPVEERVKDYQEVEMPLSQQQIRCEALRCQNCGIPFCHAMGCPLHNEIPDMNHAAAEEDWRTAWDVLSRTSPFPEFTSRICPALCEAACTLGVGFEATSVRQIEKKTIDTAFANGWVKATPPASRNGKTAAVIGAGPAGLAAANDLNAAGFQVTVYEREECVGGLMQYGIPCFKLDKALISRRQALMSESGIKFLCGVEVGRDISGEYIARTNDVVVVTIGTPVARDLKVPGRELEGIHLALEMLHPQNDLVMGRCQENPVNAKGKKVVVIGGGDTGSDCAGTSIRQGAASVLSLELMPKPPECRSASTPWPNWPYMLRTSSSIKEGVERRWNCTTLRFIGENGRLTALEIAPVKWELSPEGRPLSFKQEGESEIIPCDLALLALGFLKQSREQVLAALGMPDTPKVLVAGDAASGPSLVVKAIVSGRQAAADAAKITSL